MVCAFSGWNDAGEAASAAVSFIHASFDAAEVGSIDPEEFFDFTAVRPTVRLTEGVTREIDWPRDTRLGGRGPRRRGRPRDSSRASSRRCAGAASARTDRERGPGAGRAHGDHPRRAAGRRAAYAARCRSPASPPTRRSSTASAIQHTSYEGPTGIVGVLHHACAEAGIQSASLWASVPHYVAAAPNPKVALALVRAFEGTAGVVVDASELERPPRTTSARSRAAVASDPEVKAFVERLESAMDEVQARRGGRGAAPVSRHDRPRLPALPAPARPTEPTRAAEADQRRYFSAAGQMIR